jgi:hypothetical protein
LPFKKLIQSIAEEHIPDFHSKMVKFFEEKEKEKS